MDKIIIKDLENIYKRNIEWEALQGKTVLITGAYGMLASYLVFFILYLMNEKSFDIKLIAVVRNKDKFYQKFSSYIENRERVMVVENDLTKKIDLNCKVDYIIHAASIASPDKYATAPVEVMLPNILGTDLLLKMAVENNIKKFLFFSSGDIYGKVLNPENINEETVGMVDPLEIHSCYGESKRAGEALCMAYYREYDVPIVIARIGHTYGPTMDIENDPRVFASMMYSAIYKDSIVMKSSGLTKRPFCYIADATAAYLQLLLDEDRGTAFNVCNTDEFLSIAEFAKLLSKVSGKELIRIKRDDNDVYVENTLNLDNRPSEKKLRDKGWKTLYTTEEGLKNTYNYFLERTHEKN